MTTEDNVLAYIAGLFDGEGTVMIKQGAKRILGGRYYGLWASIANTHLETINWAQDAVGSSYVRDKWPGEEPKRNKTCYEVFWYGDKAVNFLKSILPWTHIKTNQIKIGLDFQYMMKNRKGNIILPGMMEIIESYYNQMKELHK